MAEISKIDYKPGQDNVQFLGLDIHNPVFVVSSLTIIAFVAGVLAFQVCAWSSATFTGNLSVNPANLHDRRAPTHPDVMKRVRLLSSEPPGVSRPTRVLSSRGGTGCSRRSAYRRRGHPARVGKTDAHLASSPESYPPCRPWTRSKSESRPEAGSCTERAIPLPPP